MNPLDNLIAHLGENVLKGAVKKALDPFVKQGDISAEQENVILQATLDEVQLALSVWSRAQNAKPA